MLVQLEAEGFRNLEPLSRAFEPGSHLFLGDNGAGKTSLLEAVYLLATTRSFRTPRIADCCRHGGSRFRLGGEVDRRSRVRLEVGWEAGGRWRTVNGQQASLAEHLAALPVVCWSSGDVEVLVGPPAGRRQLLDRGVVSRRPAAIAAISRYRRALQQKRELLARGGGELATWNQVLAPAAAELIALRAAYAGRLARALAEVLDRSGLGFPPIELRYRPSPPAGLEGAAIAEELAAVRRRERRMQQPLVGPQRDDLEVRWDGREVRRVASAGERKALGLALLAAQGRILEGMDRVPIYLLDDADTELDRRRLESLWRVFGACGQLFLTSNRPAVWESVEIAHRWRLSEGRIAAAE